jgi:elongation factor Ts
MTMSAISAADVKKLRDVTGAGMMDCKKALEESNGDMDGAIDYLRKKGAKVAELRAGRDANEGAVIIKLSSDNKFGVMLQLGCETDFVSKNDVFVGFANSITEVALNHKIKTTEELLAADLGGVSVQDRIAEKVGSIGENISIQSYQFIEGEQVSFYNHNNRAGAMVAMSKSSEEIATLAKDLAMQITAMKPVAVDETSVSEETREREKSIAREKAKEDGKPENMLDKIAEGALNKFFKEFTLLKQEYIKDTKKTIEQVIKETDKDVIVLGFKKAELGSK